jgi:signal transduction histidine kinase
VYQVDVAHELVEKVRQGDRIISGNGLSPAQVYNLDGKTVGDQIVFEIERGGNTFFVPIEISRPSLWLNIERLIPLVIAFGFVLAGNLAFAYYRHGYLAMLFHLLCLGAAISLASGSLAAFGQTWTRMVFQVASLCTLAFFIHLHLYFPMPVHQRTARVAGFLLLIVTLSLAIFFGVGNLVQHGILQLPIFRWIPLAQLFVDILFVIAALARSYRKPDTAASRYQTGIIVFAGLIGFLPPLFFSLIPQLVLGYPLIAYGTSFFSLLSIPIGYGYAILQFRLLGTEKTVHRGATNALLVILLGAVFTIWYIFSARLLTPEIAHSPFWLLWTVILLSILTNRAYKVLARFVNRVLYGGWYDYRSVVDTVSLSLNVKDIDEGTIGATLCQVIGTAMRLEYVSLLLPDQNMFTHFNGQADQTSQVKPDIWPALIKYLESAGIQKQFVIPISHDLKNSPGFRSCGGDLRAKHLIPLHGKGDEMLGLLLLGVKLDGQELDKSDIEILKVIVQQSQMTLENARLLCESQNQVNMISRLHMQVIRSREGERKRLARDLHDLIIQMLIGINLKIHNMAQDRANIQEEDIVSRQEEIRQVINDLRVICTELRPTNLEFSGLVPAIQSKAAEIEQNAGFRVSFLFEGNEDQEICEESKLCVYRFVQECLLNVQKHARAEIVQLWVCITSETVTVNVVDDGVGFIVPTNFNFPAKEKHLGLVGIKELVEAAKGTMQVESKPGEGCSVSAQVPV